MKEIDPNSIPKVRLDDIEERLGLLVEPDGTISLEIALNAIQEAKLRTFQYVLAYVDETPAFKVDTRYPNNKPTSTAAGTYKNIIREALKQMIEDHESDKGTS